MSLGKAIKFVRKFATEDHFRKECHLLSREDITARFQFNDFEFDDAINMQLVKCQTEEEANQYFQLRNYYQLL